MPLASSQNPCLFQHFSVYFAIQTLRTMFVMDGRFRIEMTQFHWKSSLQMVCLYNTFQFILIKTGNFKRSGIAVMR